MEFYFYWRLERQRCVDERRMSLGCSLICGLWLLRQQCSAKRRERNQTNSFNFINQGKRMEGMKQSKGWVGGFVEMEWKQRQQLARHAAEWVEWRPKRKRGKLLNKNQSFLLPPKREKRWFVVEGEIAGFISLICWLWAPPLYRGWIAFHSLQEFQFINLARPAFIEEKKK